MIDLSKDVEYLSSRPVFSPVRCNTDALTLMAALFREVLSRIGENEEDKFITLVELYEKGYIRVVSDEERDVMCIEVCEPSDAPQIKVKLN